ncbi:MAG: iron-containing alcohol dehydrogenase family protein [Clostridia bacterium]|nr:iron-containing alcohol dehydrogenase family protein [Clostridia bacterium]
MQQRFYPAYTIGEDAFDKFNEVCLPLGSRFLLVGGKTALSVTESRLLPKLSDNFEIADKVIYGNECTEERAHELYERYKDENIDFIVGVGGGKALDTAKLLSKLLGINVVTVPTIASTCAASSALSVVYTPNHVFKKFEYYKRPAFHCFIDTRIIAEAPYRYIRAGVGDTLAKHYEVEFSMRGRKLDYSSEMGLTISSMCSVPLMRYAHDAIEACKKNEINEALEQTALAILISTGMVSMLINPDYNGAMAHALFYGLTNIEGFDEKFLHGDVVGYCTMVQLAVDNNIEEAKKIKEFLKSIDIETTLAQRKIPCDKKYLDKVLESALADPDMKVIPYRVTKEMLFEGIKTVENF